MNQFENDFQRAWQLLKDCDWQERILIQYKNEEGVPKEWRGKIATMNAQAEKIVGAWNPQDVEADVIWGMRTICGPCCTMRVELLPTP